jgi:hypothetical protein
MSILNILYSIAGIGAGVTAITLGLTDALGFRDAFYIALGAGSFTTAIVAAIQSK